ncbi:MAG: DMT family transporter [Chloroflexi bacterium]|nr:DMT family transporter [Chloroflexota bacterium]
MNGAGSRSHLLPYLLLTATAFFWGGTFVAGKFAVADLPPLAVAAARFLLSWGPLAALLYFGQRGRLLPPRAALPMFALLGLTGAAIPNALIFTGLQYTSAADAALIQAALPVLAALLAALTLGERLNLRQWLGITLSLLGVAYVVGEGSLAAVLALELNLGNVMVTAAVVSWSVNGVLSKRVLARHSPLAVTTYSVFFGAIFLTALTAFATPATAWRPVGWQAVTAVVFLALFGNVIGQVWWFRGMQAVGVSRTSVFANLMPLIGIALAAVMLGERITVYHWVGTTAVLGGVLLTIWTPELLGRGPKTTGAAAVPAQPR